jgi:hypothetical protein
MTQMPRSIALIPLVFAAAVGIGCGDDESPTPTTPTTPTAIVETFSETLNPNGGRTHQFNVERAGTIQARLVSMAPDDTVAVGVSLGTWNGSACQIVIANDNVTVSSSTTIPVLGSATGTGAFCVRVYDIGKLTQSVDYAVTVEHF